MESSALEKEAFKSASGINYCKSLKVPVCNNLTVVSRAVCSLRKIIIEGLFEHVSRVDLDYDEAAAKNEESPRHRLMMTENNKWIDQEDSRLRGQLSVPSARIKFYHRCQNESRKIISSSDQRSLGNF